MFADGIEIDDGAEGGGVVGEIGEGEEKGDGAYA